MNGIDDKLLSREALKGFYVFLHSERLRHGQDIRDIGVTMRRLEKEQEYTLKELWDMKMQASRYINF